MGEREPPSLLKTGGGGRGSGKTWGLESLPLSNLALEACLPRAQGPARAPARGAIPEGEEGALVPL